MSEITESKLKEEIEKFLKTADLSTTSTKKVIQELEKKLGVELRQRKDEIDKIVMDYINSMESDEGSGAEGSEDKSQKSDDESDEKSVRVTRRGTVKKGKGEKTGGGVTKAKRGKGKGGNTGFTRAYKLSPELSELMGESEMPRHAVVKRIWAMVKEKQMYDPNNKQYAICDEALYKVIGKHRFRVFAMMKYLKNHFL